MFKLNKLAIFCGSLVLLTPTISQSYMQHLPDLGKPQRLYLSSQQETELGKKMLSTLRDSGLLLDDPIANDYLESVGQRLIKKSAISAPQFHFLLINLPGINAFAGPDGYIFVHTGLLLAAQSEDELAAVLAHEIGHVTQGHLARRIAEAKRMRVPFVAGLLAASALTVVSGGAASGALAATLAGTEQHQLNYSRSHETEADNVGLDVLVKAGYDPNAIASFFKRLLKKQNSYEEVPELLSTHPLTENRIAEIESRVAQLPPQQYPSDKDFAFIQQRLTVITSDDAHHTELMYRKKAQNHTNDVAIQYGFALALLATHEYTKAYNKLRTLDQRNLFIPLALATAAFESNHQPQALQILQQLQQRYPKHYAVNVTYAYYLLQAKQPKQATQILQHYRLQYPDEKIPYELLARGQAESGDKAAAYQTRADLFLSLGQPANALNQLQTALQYSKNNPQLRTLLQAKMAAVRNLSG